MTESGNKDTEKNSESTTTTGKKILGSLIFIFGIALFIGALWFYVGGNDIEVFSFLTKLLPDTEEDTIETVKVCVRNDLSGDIRGWTTEWSDGLDSQSDIEVEVVHYEGTHSSECGVIVSSEDEGEFDMAWKRYFVLVGHVSLEVENITIEELTPLLGGESAEISGTKVHLSVEKSSADSVDRMLGIGVGVERTEDLVDKVFQDSSLIGIIPFEQLSPKVKEIALENSSLLKKANPEDHLLIERIWVWEGDQEGLFSQLQMKLGELNYHEERIRTVIMTGTSVVGARRLNSISRQKNDWLFPIRKVGPVLEEADIAHISNEASFADNCEQDDWTMRFCGPVESFEGLTWAGIDVVGLTGNHILDAGTGNFISTLDMFNEAGIKYFGGGVDINDALEPAIIELDGYSVAFLGFNMIPPDSYYAEEAEGGSAPLEMELMKETVSSAKEKADYVFVDMQWGDEYVRQPNQYQIDYGHSAVDAGADIVTGVHPHWIQPVEYYKDGIIFYSLGNFLFDQLWSEETREGLMVRHYFYDGKYAGYELIPVRISDEYQPEIVEGDEGKRISSYALSGI